ncbi:DUF4265 domain-containing protein [Embleya sp. NPDC005575]|uniref:DUF4265 domain-containing protein n=1 Tax=Embleya sp. NPDC005575 TaxID=3156892 RepID=UPI0033B7C7C6
MRTSIADFTGTVIQHDNPVDRAERNYICHAVLEGEPESREQLWTELDAGEPRLRPPARAARLACLPFFTYGLCRGDIIAVDGDDFVVGVLEKSGHRLLRAAFVRDHPLLEGTHADVHDELVRLNMPHEWLQGTYVSADLSPGADPTEMIELLQRLKEQGRLHWEIDA